MAVTESKVQMKIIIDRWDQIQTDAIDTGIFEKVTRDRKP